MNRGSSYMLAAAYLVVLCITSVIWSCDYGQPCDYKIGKEFDYLPSYKLVRYAQEGKAGKVARFLREGVNANSVGPLSRGRNPALTMAAMNGHARVARCLIENTEKREIVISDTKRRVIDNKANVNKLNLWNETPLILAVSGGYIDVVNYLLSQGADVHIPTKYNDTALGIASAKGYREIVISLVRAGAVGRYFVTIPKPKAKFTADLRLVWKDGGLAKFWRKVAVSDEARLDELRRLCESHDEVRTEHPLLKIEGDDVMELVCKSYADTRNENPLFLAAINGHKEIVRILIEESRLFTEGRKWLEPSQEFGDVPLVSAVRNKDMHVSRLLLEYGANINKRDKTGETSLMVAIRNGKKSFVEFLLYCPLNRDIQNFKMQTALDVARECGKEKITKIIEEYYKC